jgi:hypothetical protein
MLNTKINNIYIFYTINNLSFIYIQGEHKVFPWLQTFITRKPRGIQTYIYIFQNVTQLKKFFYNTLVHFNMCSFCIPHSFLVINVSNQGKTLCSPYKFPYSHLCNSWSAHMIFLLQNAVMSAVAIHFLPHF